MFRASRWGTKSSTRIVSTALPIHHQRMTVRPQLGRERMSRFLLVYPGTREVYASGTSVFCDTPKLDSVGNLGIWLTTVGVEATLAGTCEAREIPEECVMSIRPRLGVEVPELTARIARASNPAGTTAMWVPTAFQDYLDQHDIKRLRSWRAVS
jgi:hypothetical protein